MAIEEFIPSWLTSWVAWRNFYTEPGKEPFSVLKEELGMTRVPMHAEFIMKNGGGCPYCHDDAVVLSQRFGLVYCICKVLEKMQRLEAQHAAVRSPIGKAYLRELEFHPDMGGDYKRTMGKAVKEVERFIKYPSKWLFVSGHYGTGKTHLLKAINSAFEPMSLYVSARDLEQKTHTFRKEDELDFFYDVLTNAPVLLLDDIGMEYGGQLVKSIIEKVVDARYERYPDYPLVIATNKSDITFAEYIPRVHDRVLDRDRTVILGINTNKSYRDIVPEMRK